MVFFFGFFQEVNTKIHLVFYSFRNVSILSRKNLFPSLDRFIIVLCKPFVMNFPWSDQNFRHVKNAFNHEFSLSVSFQNGLNFQC